MKKDRAQAFKLQVKYDKLLIEFQELKKIYMGVLNDCMEKKHDLREKVKSLKDSYNKLLHEEQNKGWNDLYGYNSD